MLGSGERPLESILGRRRKRNGGDQEERETKAKLQKTELEMNTGNLCLCLKHPSAHPKEQADSCVPAVVRSPSQQVYWEATEA